MIAIYPSAKDNKIPLILDLAINNKIHISRNADSKYVFTVKDLSDVTEEKILLLQAINDGKRPSVGDEIVFDSNLKVSNRSLFLLSGKFNRAIHARMVKDGLVGHLFKMRKTSDMVSSGTATLLRVILIMVAMYLLLPVAGLILVIINYVRDLCLPDVVDGAIMVGKDYLPYVMLLIFFCAFALALLLHNKTQKFKHYTREGLKAVRYMDGLKLYIKKAEKERLEFLQSASNVDVSKEGILHLYEKLLPYAAVFGCAESWLKELAAYYVDEDANLAWYSGGMTASEAFDAIDHASHAIIDAVARYNAAHSYYDGGGGGGGWSSGGSGGGGGGFSGGGGGHGR